MACKQENMSTRIEVTHPDLNIVAKKISRQKMKWYCVRRSSRNPAWSAVHGQPLASRQFRSIIFPLAFTIPRPIHLRLLEPPPFRFEDLPPTIQTKIFGMWLIWPGRLIHCISRLDSENAPVNFPKKNEDEGENLPSKRTYLHHRIHFSRRPCFIPAAKRPGDLLRLLLVSKRFCYIGAHAFYGANTLSFSSLSEFGKFAAGIGEARLQRIANVELLLQGNQMPRVGRIIEAVEQKNQWKPVKPGHERISQRTAPLTYLMSTIRLRTLVVHIEECGSGSFKGSRMRRKYECRGRADYLRGPEPVVENSDDSVDENNDDCYLAMKRRTAVQPNARDFRSLRTVHGLDYIAQLRGLKWCRFYTTDRGVANRTLVRDWSFSLDIQTQTTQPKTNKDALNAMIENLMPLTGLEEFDPTDEDMQIASSFYNDRPPGGVDTVESDDSSSSESESESDDESSDDEGSDSNDDDDDDGSDDAGSDNDDDEGSDDGSSDNDGDDDGSDNGGSLAQSSIADVSREGTGPPGSDSGGESSSDDDEEQADPDEDMPDVSGLQLSDTDEVMSLGASDNEGDGDGDGDGDNDDSGDESSDDNEDDDSNDDSDDNDADADDDNDNNNDNNSNNSNNNNVDEQDNDTWPPPLSSQDPGDAESRHGQAAPTVSSSSLFVRDEEVEFIDLTLEDDSDAEGTVIKAESPSPGGRGSVGGSGGGGGGGGSVSIDLTHDSDSDDDDAGGGGVVVKAESSSSAHSRIRSPGGGGDGGGDGGGGGGGGDGSRKRSRSDSTDGLGAPKRACIDLT
ncbi:hypothetical protein GGR56DRAFT_404392 [Xylariaceae sp. FL0804]|nr:hypothetical protein GGR56DRAFT_404392 [Xylariaceae sp. FL0804]